jgi:hypothetical protein
MQDPHGPMPQAPTLSSDIGVKNSIPTSTYDKGTIPSLEDLDLSTLSPLAALKLLTQAVSSTVCDNRPPTPPASSPTTPRSLGFEDEGRHHVEVPNHHKTPIGSPESHPHDNGPQPPQLFIDIAFDYDRQCQAMARAFYCKVPPPITVQAYLQRIHHYCSMSTGVYLAAACYIQRITRSLWSTSPDQMHRGIYAQITPRSVHRLTLAALRLAHKSMEDHTWAHSRFAGVGGVPVANLTKLELSLCYLLDFRLLCTRDELLDAARWMIQGYTS